MSATGETTNYGLPLYNGTDYANFFDMNTTNNKLDEVLKSIQTRAETADTKAEANTTAIDQANDSINDNMTAIDGIQTNLTTFQQTLNTQGTRIGNMETSVNGVSATLETVSSDIATQGTRIGNVETSVNEVSATLETVSSDIATNTGDITKLKNITHIKMRNITNINGNISDEFTVNNGGSTWYIGRITIRLTTEGGLKPTDKILDVKSISAGNIPGGITSIITTSNFNGISIGAWNIIMTYISSVSLENTHPRIACTILYF